MYEFVFQIEIAIYFDCIVFLYLKTFMLSNLFSILL